jgi:hypothetical protein
MRGPVQPETLKSSSSTCQKRMQSSGWIRSSSALGQQHTHAAALWSR